MAPVLFPGHPHDEKAPSSIATPADIPAEPDHEAPGGPSVATAPWVTSGPAPGPAPDRSGAGGLVERE